jgi:hypothetical protein
MQIPIGATGVPTLSANQIRTYGAGTFRLDGYENPKGCPRQYRKRYVEHVRPPQQTSMNLSYGSAVHAALALMEEEAIGPDEALSRVWPADLDLESFREAVGDLEKYLARGGPMNLYATIANELDLSAVLYEDEEFGPIAYRGIVDWLGIDTEDEGLLHVVDYKTNRFPPSNDAVRGDVQLKGYDWLVRQNQGRFGFEGGVRTTVHLDAIKYRDVAVQWTQAEIDEWQDWTVAIARRILRDGDGAPVLNAGCNWCPVRHDCPTFISLPNIGRGLLQEREVGKSLEEQARWEKEARLVKGLLDTAIKDVARRRSEALLAEGPIRIDDVEYFDEPGWVTDIDLDRLERVLGRNRFLRMVSTSKTAIDEATKTDEPETRVAAMACISSVPSGRAVKQRKVRGDG